MKRSKAIELLNDIINAGLPEEHVFSLDQLSTVLERIEHFIGMEPPKITILPNSYDRSTGNYGFEVNEWEEE